MTNQLSIRSHVVYLGGECTYEDVDTNEVPELVMASFSLCKLKNKIMG